MYFYINIYIYIYIERERLYKTMGYIYDKIIYNSWNEKDKLQIKIVLEKDNNRLQTYKDIVDKAPPKRSSEEYTNKVIEDTITKSRGRPKQYYTEEDIEALKQKKKISQKGITKMILKKENIKKQSGQIITDH